MEQPALSRGVRFAPGLVERIIQEMPLHLRIRTQQIGLLHQKLAAARETATAGK